MLKTTHTEELAPLGSFLLRRLGKVGNTLHLYDILVGMTVDQPRDSRFTLHVSLGNLLDGVTRHVLFPYGEYLLSSKSSSHIALQCTKELTYLSMVWLLRGVVLHIRSTHTPILRRFGHAFAFGRWQPTGHLYNISEKRSYLLPHLEVPA